MRLADAVATKDSGKLRCKSMPREDTNDRPIKLIGLILFPNLLDLVAEFEGKLDEPEVHLSALDRAELWKERLGRFDKGKEVEEGEVDSTKDYLSPFHPV